MQPNPFLSLLKSRKFWLMILDLVVSGIIYFVPKYTAPEIAQDLLWLVAAIQPVFVTVIGAVAYEDRSRLEADAKVAVASATCIEQ